MKHTLELTNNKATLSVITSTTVRYTVVWQVTPQLQSLPVLY